MSDYRQAIAFSLTLCVLTLGTLGSSQPSAEEIQEELQEAKPAIVSPDIPDIVVPENFRQEPAPLLSDVPTVATLQLVIGQVQTMSLSDVKRVAIGDPELVDVTIVSPKQILMRAKQPGSTNLIIWDSLGEHETLLEITGPGAAPKAEPTVSIPEIAEELRDLLSQFDFPPLKILPRADKIFLIGTLEDEQQRAALNQVLSTFKEHVVNLVQVETTLKKTEAVSTGGPLVSLSVQVVEINRSALQELGVKWSESFKVTEDAMSSASLSDTLFRVGQSVSRGTLSTTLSALVRESKARVLAEPRLVTADGKQASSFIGLEVPIVTATSFGTSTSTVSASIEHRETGVLLQMTPHVNQQRNRPTTITIEMQAEISDIDKSVGLNVPVGNQTAFVPGFTVRKANTEVTMHSGETVAIAGLLKVDDSDTVDKVPGLSNIPVLGTLFRAPERESKQRELVITLTPELLLDETSRWKQKASVPPSTYEEDEDDEAYQAEEAEPVLPEDLSVSELRPSAPIEEDPRLTYAMQVQEQIAQAIRYPLQERPFTGEGTVKLRLQLFADGTLGRAQIIQSSGTSLFDQEALSAAKIQAPYPPFPAELAERELWLDIPVVFTP